MKVVALKNTKKLKDTFHSCATIATQSILKNPKTKKKNKKIKTKKKNKKKEY